ncbi:MAG: hypothetical protein QM767_15830 [Anaeromyxobacter sp.]
MKMFDTAPPSIAMPKLMTAAITGIAESRLNCSTTWLKSSMNDAFSSNGNSGVASFSRHVGQFACAPSTEHSLHMKLPQRPHTPYAGFPL